MCGEQTASGARIGGRLAQLEKARDCYVSCDVCSFAMSSAKGPCGVIVEKGDWPRLGRMQKYARLDHMRRPT